MRKGIRVSCSEKFTEWPYRIYAHAETKIKDVGPKRLPYTRATSIQSLMMTVGVLKLDCIRLVFVDLGLKVDGAYAYHCDFYHNICCHQVLAELIFQQDCPSVKSTLQWFSDVNMAQGSVSTRLRCGWIFSGFLLTIFNWTYRWKNCETRSISDED